MNRLFIAEKPSVGKAIAEALGKTKSDKGYCETKSGDVVTWCFGHLMELATPDVYLPDDVPTTKSGSKVWREQDLPIVPDRWKIQGNYSEPSPKIMSALPEKAEVNASKALMPCLLPVLMNDISLT